MALRYVGTFVYTLLSVLYICLALQNFEPFNETRNFGGNNGKENNANKYWIYGEDAALAAQFTAYLGKVLKNRRSTYIRHLNKIQAKEYSYEDMAETIEQIDSIREESLESTVESS